MSNVRTYRELRLRSTPYRTEDKRRPRALSGLPGFPATTAHTSPKAHALSLTAEACGSGKGIAEAVRLVSANNIRQHPRWQKQLWNYIGLFVLVEIAGGQWWCW